MNNYAVKSFSPIIDHYIQNSAEFARPILEYIRHCVHIACPDAEETIKWNFPHFMYKNRILCSMASFKSHCAFTFWNSQSMNDQGLLEKSGRTAMGHLGKIKAIEDMPKIKPFLNLIVEAMKCIDEDRKADKPVTREKKTFETPVSFLEALKKNAAAAAHYNKFSATKKKDYLEWFAEAKTDSTLNKRISTAIEWLSEGKSRNWKYEKK